MIYKNKNIKIILNIIKIVGYIKTYKNYKNKIIQYYKDESS